MAQSIVEVSGLRELSASLKAASEEAPKELQRTNKRVAEFLAGEIRSAAPHLSGRLSSRIRASAGQLSAKVTVGAGVPYAGVQEFGGRVPRRGFAGTHGHVLINPATGAPAVTRIKPYRGSTSGNWWDDTAGYFAFPQARRHRDEVGAMYEELAATIAGRI